MAWNQWFIHKLLFILLFITYHLDAIFLLFSNSFFPFFICLFFRITSNRENISSISNQHSAVAAAATAISTTPSPPHTHIECGKNSRLPNSEDNTRANSLLNSNERTNNENIFLRCANVDRHNIQSKKKETKNETKQKIWISKTSNFHCHVIPRSPRRAWIFDVH